MRKGPKVMRRCEPRGRPAVPRRPRSPRERCTGPVGINKMTGMTLLPPLSEFFCDAASAHKYKYLMKLHLRVQLSGTDSCACANADAQCAMPRMHYACSWC